MPFTPFHVGPALLLGILLYRWTDLSTLLVGSVIITAVNGNWFVNDAAKNLKYKPFYDDSDILIALFHGRPQG